jgi:quercetin dioxygenase-like cupin family protein
MHLFCVGDITEMTAALAKRRRRTDMIAVGPRASKRAKAACFPPLPDFAAVAKAAAKVYPTAPQEQERDIMSNSFVKTDARTEAKSFFVLGDKVERRARLTGNWLNIFDVTVAPGGKTPRHAHASPEVFRIIEGTLTIWRLTDTGPEEIEASAGDIVTIAPFMVHGYANNGSVPAVFSAVVDRDMAEFIETEGVSEQPQGSPSPETAARMRAAANAHGITILAA